MVSFERARMLIRSQFNRGQGKSKPFERLVRSHSLSVFRFSNHRVGVIKSSDWERERERVEIFQNSHKKSIKLHKD